MDKKEFMIKYGNLQVVFSYYYKYVFSFSGITSDGCTVNCRYGGDRDEIYRFDVVAGNTYTLNEIDPDSASIQKDGELINEFES